MTTDATIVPAFDSVTDVAQRLSGTGYLPDSATATATYLADRLGKPLLVEGPAGVGKTELAKAIAAATDAELVRLQCYEGLDEARALYEWNHAKQILHIQSTGARDWDDTKTDIFSDEFLLPRPLLKAISRDEPTVLLIDEVDKADVDMEGLLLEVLSDFAVSIPEMGTVRAVQRPIVILTSNAARELSEALKRRCLYLHIDFPDAGREKEILASRVPDLPDVLAAEVVRIIGALRGLDIRKKPSVSETIDWGNTLLALSAGAAPGTPEANLAKGRVDDSLIERTLGVVLKHRPDLATARKELKLDKS
ncbi:MAG TPA: MoxR family ATPase [Gordonia sp. (in: high G+C Gram-positive bacteria)]|uniref:AAA family ATPase n=1 Tax=unclassified Gordonia (in: high G+C Gram-positive bacteria) TaxID=2657482 RepID=UPI0025C7410B|nr:MULTISPECIES: MoxR family ATPase [unclassified Gordonia (in: high G+C Gram-positive bacteria)]HNP57321.1 MoxR family ATPase [Gordonia sp. (in: high G+C Gram-positive bacteria)]HRC50867.1 MoxR family ATPase [Gordonia sp. (in: high G+C Gram-positive bacteria)]